MGGFLRGWRVCILKDTGRWRGGGTPNKSNSTYWSGHIPWVSPKDMKLSIINRTEDNITEEAIKDSSTNLIEKDSLLLVARSGILKHTLPVAIAGRDLTVNQDMKVVSVFKHFNHLYLFYLFEAKNHEILRGCLKAGNTVESLDFQLLLDYQIPAPSYIEQEQIASMISSIQSKISIKQQKLQQTQNLKKSLMQDLLTGKVRVSLNRYESYNQSK